MTAAPDIADVPGMNGGYRMESESHINDLNVGKLRKPTDAMVVTRYSDAANPSQPANIQTDTIIPSGSMRATEQTDKLSHRLRCFCFLLYNRIIIIILFGQTHLSHSRQHSVKPPANA